MDSGCAVIIVRGHDVGPTLTANLQNSRRYSLAVRSTPVPWKPEVGAPEALELLAATRGDVDHSRLLVSRAVGSPAVSLFQRKREFWN